MPMPILPQKSPHTPTKELEVSTKAKLLASFQDADGNLDFEKLAVTGKQVMDVYDQVSPLISRVFKK